MRNQIDYSKWTFSDDGVSEGGCYLEQSLPSTALGYNTLEATVRCPDREILNFTLNAPLTWRYRGQIQAILYVQSILRVGPDLYAISAISAVGRLASMPHPGGVYTGQLVEAVVPELCGDVPVIVKTNLRKIPLYGWLPYAKPPEKSARDNLAQILFSIGASLGTDLDGVLRVEPLWDGISNVVDADRMYQDGTVETEAAVSAVTVTEHQYTAGGETETLFEGSTEEGHLVIFDAPHSDLTANGFTIRASGANWARLSAGAGTLTGRAYVHTTRMLTESVTSGAAENIQSVSDCTMISLFNSTAAVRRMAAYYGCRTRIDVPILVHTVRPGQRISILNPYDRVLESGVVASMDVTMSGVLKGQTQVVMGYVPPQPDRVEYFSRRELFIKDTTYVIPANVTAGRLVLIGGGNGGLNGKDGTSGGAGQRATLTGSSGIQVAASGQPGEGGLGGSGGGGGKILSVDLTVQKGDVLSVQIGDGGGSESPGGETTLSILRNGSLVESYSSADGTAYPFGYTDAVTGDVYATRGSDGIAGANGGAAGTLDDPAQSGGAVGEYLGGAGLTTPGGITSVTNTGPYVFVNYTQHTQNGAPEIYRTSLTGYTSYKIGDEGIISTSGYQQTVGVTGGKVVEGTVYKNPSNGSVSGSTRSDIEEYVVTSTGSTTSCSVKKNIINTIRTYKQGRTTTTTGVLPSGGGGAAYGNTGGDALIGGGTGASAENPNAQNVLGAGGNGGHGGGGGGAGGGGVVQLDKATSSDYPDYEVTGRRSGAAGGSAGGGSVGGSGCHGCTILYFGEPRIINSGQLVTSDKKFFFDRLGRIFVV